MSRTARLLLAAFLCAPLLAVTPARALTTNITSIADTSLHHYHSNYNLGGMVFTVAGTLNQGFTNRALYKFNVTEALPAGATVTAATLNLVVFIPQAAGMPFRLHRMLRDWGEGDGSGQGMGLGSPADPGDATWNARFHPSELWAAPGGLPGTDYVADASATNIMTFSSLSFSYPPMISDIQAWLDDPDTNFGWMILIDDETPLRKASQMGSRESGASGPQLVIEYTTSTPPPPATPPDMFDVALTGSDIRFSFNAESNRTYAVEFRDSLTTTNWSVLTNIPAQPADTPVHFTNSISVSERYFRVRTP